MKNRNHLTSSTYVAAHKPNAFKPIGKLLAGAVVALVAISVNAANYPLALKINPGVLKPLPSVTVKPVLYAAKFVCGPQLRAATGIGQTLRFAAVEPGHYATALNILPLINGSPSIDIYAAMEDSVVNPLVAHFSISGAYRMYTVTCEEILASFGVSVVDEAYEGFLYVERRQPDLEMQAVYTYASRDEFTDWLGVDQKGNVVANPEIGLKSIGGAGGLGLGASIDVERIEPIDRSGLHVN